MTQINRRTALSLVAAAGAVGATATEASAHAPEEALRTLWRERTQAWVRANETQHASRTHPCMSRWWSRNKGRLGYSMA